MNERVGGREVERGLDVLQRKRQKVSFIAIVACLIRLVLKRGVC